MDFLKLARTTRREGGGEEEGWTYADPFRGSFCHVVQIPGNWRLGRSPGVALIRQDTHGAQKKKKMGVGVGVGVVELPTIMETSTTTTSTTVTTTAAPRPR